VRKVHDGMPEEEKPRTTNEKMEIHTGVNRWSGYKKRRR
jgi:hypothetical protein